MAINTEIGFLDKTHGQERVAGIHLWTNLWLTQAELFFFFSGGGVILVCFFWLVDLGFCFAKWRWPSRNPKQQAVHKAPAHQGSLVPSLPFFLHFAPRLCAQAPTPHKALSNSRRMKFFPFQNVCAPHIKHNSNKGAWGAGTHMITQLTWSQCSQAERGIDFLNSSAPTFSVLKFQVQKMQNFFWKLTACHNFNNVIGKGKGNF